MAAGTTKQVCTVDVRDRNGNQIARLELNLAETTPHEVLDHLKNEGRIPDRDPLGTRVTSWLAYNQRELVSDQTLASQGVVAGAILTVEFRHVKGAAPDRLAHELQLLKELERQSAGHIVVDSEPTLREFTVTLRVRGPVLHPGGYRISDQHVLTIALPDDFPVRPPALSLAQAVLVPNCFSDGTPCLLRKGEDPWRPATRLVGVVREVVEMIQGGGQNTASTANAPAARLWERSRIQLEREIGERYVPPVVDQGQDGQMPADESRIRSLGPRPTQPASPARSAIRTL